MVRSLIGCMAVLAAWAVGRGQTTRPAATTRPAGRTLQETYSARRPDFLDERRLRENDPLKLSLQPWFYNMAHLEQDFRVEALLKKADELFAARDFRRAMKLYHEVVAQFPDDLWRIQENGVFIPSVLYAQRRLLRMPDDQILYYRTLYDAEARALFDRARKYYSLLDFAEVAERHLATSYGDDALWELGNAALDQGNYAGALAAYRRIQDICALSDVPTGDLAMRMAECYKHLGREEAYRQARRLAMASSGSVGRDARAAFFRRLDAVVLPKSPYFRQVRKPEYTAMGDYDLMPDLTVPIKRERFVWSQPLPDAQRQWYVRALPWVAGNYVYFKHHNALFCRSLLTGKENWSFAPGGLIDWFDVAGLNQRPHPPFGGANSPTYHPESDLLVHDGLVFAGIVKAGPSLVALDRITGQVRWAKGPIASAAEEDRNTRYLCAPAPGPNVVYAPVVRENIEGRSHLNSTVGINCFDSHSGRLIWSRTICLVTPPKFTTSTFVRRIRLYGTQPTVKGGVVYHTTNAGVVAALDALSGTVLWVTRYPHAADIHDLLKKHGPLWFSRPPLLMDGRLFVTPTDCDRLLCLDPETGAVRWSRPRGRAQTLVGVTARRNLVVTGLDGLLGIDPATGRTLWERGGAPKDLDRPLGGGAVVCRAAITRSDRIYLNTTQWSGTFGEQYWDIHGRKTLAQRYYYYPGTWGSLWNFNRDVRRRAEREKREPRPDEFLSNTTDPFHTYHRWAFERFGTVFEMEISPQRVSMWYDAERVRRAMSGDTSAQGLYSRAELRNVAGDRPGAISLFEKALAALPVWDTPMRTEVNRQLFRLYRRQAEAVMRAGDLKQAERWARQMADACTASRDEILTVLSLAEIFEKQERWSDAAACLTAAIKHYGAVRFGVPSILAGDSDALQDLAAALLKNLRDKNPKAFYGPEFRLAVAGAEAILGNYFSVISPLEPEAEVETRQFAGHRLSRLVARAPASFRAQRETAAAKALEGADDEAVTLKRIAEYPGTVAAQAALDALIRDAEKRPEPDRRIALWRINDAARINGLSVPRRVADACNIVVREPEPGPLAPPCRQVATTLKYDPETLLLLLRRDGETTSAAELAFVGMRSKRRHANKFGLVCWDLANGRKRWEVTEIRLKDKGEEEGFETYFIHPPSSAAGDRDRPPSPLTGEGQCGGDPHRRHSAGAQTRPAGNRWYGGRVIVHGWYDVLAFSLDKGDLAWRFRVPHDFRIQASAAAEDVMVLADDRRTVAIHLRTGQLIWEANETGSVYAPPVLRDNVLATVRRNPSCVTFRNLGTGWLLTTVQLPALTEATGNPAIDWDDPAVPACAAGDLLVLTDGWDYIGVDLKQRKVRWQRRIQDVDRTGGEPPPFRFWMNGSAVAVLKPDYDSIGLEVIDPAEGTVRWHRTEAKEPGVPHHAVVGSDAVLGLHYTADDPTGVHVVAYDLATGKQRVSTVHRGRTKPRFWLTGRLQGRYLVARLSDEQTRSLWIVDGTTGAVVERIKAKGFGEWGRYGQVSWAVQPPYLAVLSDKDLIVASPAAPGRKVPE